jgi:hypothetical protein
MTWRAEERGIGKFLMDSSCDVVSEHGQVSTKSSEAFLVVLYEHRLIYMSD